MRDSGRTGRTWLDAVFVSTVTVLSVFGSSGCRTTESASSDIKFYGADNQSAVIRYESYIEVAIPAGINSQAAVLSEPIRSEMLELINWQVQHMFGTFTEHPDYAKNPGIVHGRGVPKIKGAKLDRARGVVRVTYSFEDKVIFKKKVLANGDTTIKFVLPRDPSTIYAKGVPTGSYENKCTDEHYNSEGDFWYFWNPKRSGCPLTDEDLVVVEAELKPIPNTTSTYPYYDKILGDNGNGRTLRIVYLVGIDENFRAGDLGRGTFNEAFDALKQLGFKVTSDSSARKKNMTVSHNDFDVELTLQLVDPHSQLFLEAAADGLENADVFIYDGHSGLGGYLNLERFEDELGRKLKLSRSKSQIFYFNGCSTFAYYNADYFKLKSTTQDPEGRKNLDIITTSIGATFDIGARHDLVLIDALISGKRPSWQKIMDDIYKVDRSQTALTHVNGDEDNPTSPQ